MMELAKQKLFLIPDVHGCYRELQELLKFVPPDVKILFLGDVIDRGEAPLKTLHLVMNLVKSGKAFLLLGNHEQALLDMVDGKLAVDAYWRGGGRKTLLEASSEEKMTFDNYPKLLKNTFVQQLDFLRCLPIYMTMDNLLFVHAGVPSNITGLEQLNKNDAIWIREPFYDRPHKVPYTIFFGHTPVYDIHGGTHQEIWYDTDKTKFGLDGGCCFNKQLNGILLDPFEQTLQIFKAWGSYQYKAASLIKSTYVTTITY